MQSRRIACAMWIIGLLGVPGAAWAQSPTAGATGGSSATQTLPAGEILPRTIPIFPLQDVMLFPNLPRPLHIFEPRYRAMVADALKGDRIIGMVLLRPGYEADYEGRPPVYPIGCAGVITDVEQLPDGRYAILLRGLVKFRVISEDRSRAYRLARVEAKLHQSFPMKISSTGSHNTCRSTPSTGKTSSSREACSHAPRR